MRNDYDVIVEAPPRDPTATQVAKELTCSLLLESTYLLVGCCIALESYSNRARIAVINKPTTVELCISPVYRRLAVAKFSKSTMQNGQRKRLDLVVVE